MRPLGDILVLGLGTSGVESARYAAALVSRGEAASVTAVDSSSSDALRVRAEQLRALGVAVELGVSEFAGHWDVAIVSPGIPPHAALYRRALVACDRVISEIEFAFTRTRNPWVAVTGTNGKTTTTSLIAHILDVAGVGSRTVGNIGHAAIAAVEDAERDDVFVAEVSSFQLHAIETFRPRVAVLLNITPDHLNWHGTHEAYADDKARLFENMGGKDVAVIDVDDPGSAPYAEMLAQRGIRVVRVSRSSVQPGGATAIDGMLALDTPEGALPLVHEDDLLIRGAHNVSNALAAAAATRALGVSVEDVRRGLTTFEPIEHRLEPVLELGGVGWFNDSKATNPDAVLKALTAFGDRPLIVLLGGRNKGSDMAPLACAVGQRAKLAIVFGEAAEELSGAFAGVDIAVVRVADLAQAVEAAAASAQPGDAVVLSPACASFDEFDSYEHRGTVFKSLVAAMAREGLR